jgi:transmembrane sensor
MPYERELFEEWLQLNEVNRTAWKRAQSGWTAFDGAQDDELVEEMRRYARAARPVRSEHWTRWAAAAALLITVGTGSIVAERSGLFDGGQGPDASPSSPSAPISAASFIYVNGRALPKVITLPDGSRLTLDARSRVTATFSSDRRSLQLLDGRAFFDVRHDAARPFSVRVRGLDVVDIGTRFDVRLAAREVRLTLVEGRLAVSTAKGGSKPLLMSGGQQLVAPDNGTPELSRSNVDEALQWQQGFATFNNETLVDAAAQLNRYPGDRLVVRDPRVATLRVSGMFKTGNPERFGRTLEQIYPVRVVKNGNDLEIRPAR